MTEKSSVLYDESQEAFDDRFRWRVAAAVVEHARRIIDDHPDATAPTPAFAVRAVWDWIDVSEVFARYLRVGLKIPLAAEDDAIKEAVRNAWPDLAAGMPAKE